MQGTGISVGHRWFEKCTGWMGSQAALAIYPGVRRLDGKNLAMLLGARVAPGANEHIGFAGAPRTKPPDLAGRLVKKPLELKLELI